MSLRRSLYLLDEILLRVLCLTGFIGRSPGSRSKRLTPTLPMGEADEHGPTPTVLRKTVTEIRVEGRCRTCAGGRLRDIFEGGGESVGQSPTLPGLDATIPTMTS